MGLTKKEGTWKKLGLASSDADKMMMCIYSSKDDRVCEPDLTSEERAYF